MRITIDGPSNVSNAGLVHLGSRGPGSAAACGNSRAHMTMEKEKFRALPSGSQCQRCQEKLAKWDQMKAAREGDAFTLASGILTTGSEPGGLVQVDARGITINIRRR